MSIANESNVEVTQAQARFFEAFGYLILPNSLKTDIDWITEEFEQTFLDRGIEHDGTRRSAIVPFLDVRERMCSLIDHPVIQSVLTCLAGVDANYIGSDGNYYSGDTKWHSDGAHAVGTYLKIAVYLDPVTRESGALRVIPGSHRAEAHGWEARQARDSLDLWGIPGRDVPCTVLESQPGDLVVFNHNLMHSAWGGGKRRRMFTINIASRATAPEELEELRSYISNLAVFWNDTVYGEHMLSTAGPSRLRHLQQVVENQHHLAPLAAKARSEMAEPAAGVRYPAQQ